jgi:acyl-homoserine-lactone acylase
MRLWSAAAVLCLLSAPALAAGETARLKEEAGRVTITRDDWGIAHVHGKSDADAVFGMAYAQAEDDFNRVETNYATNLGRMAEAEGEKAIWADLRQKLFLDPVFLKAQYAKSPAWLQALMTGWADGLNYYLATHPKVKPRVIYHFEPWMALCFTEGSIGGDIEKIAPAGLEAFYGKARAAFAAPPDLAYREPVGSNGFAIAPSDSASGHALLMINPHTSFFFRSELQISSDAGLNAYGAATWGQPFIYQGFNEHLGFMHTSTTLDAIDEFAETVTQKDGKWFYKYGNEERPLTQKIVTVFYRKPDGVMASRKFTTYATHHGPIVQEVGGQGSNKWIAFAMMNKPVEALEQSWLRTKASDYAGYMKVADLKANSSNNTLFADDKGEIALLLPQFDPRRDNRFDYLKPVDGSDPATDWQGLTPLDQVVHVTNPRLGWLYNTNNGPWSGAGPDSPKRADYPRYTDRLGENARGWHATEVLMAHRNLTLDDLVQKIAHDPHMPAFDRLIPLLVADQAKTPDPKLAEQVALLKDWDRRWSDHSLATSLAVFWGEALWEKCAAAANAAGVQVLDYMIASSTPQQRLSALAEATARLEKDFGNWRVAWGEINRLQRNDGAIVQTFDDAKPSIPVPFASSQWGSLASFGAKRYPGTRRYYGTSGNSFVAAVEFGPRVRAMAVSTGGESGDPASPHFFDQAIRYAQEELRPVYFWPDELKGHVTATYHPGE